MPTITVTGPTASTWRVSEPSSGLSLDMDGLTLASTTSVEFDILNRTATLIDTYERSRTLRSDLVALWMLDETSGTTADNEQGTSARDGTYTGGYTLNQSGPLTGIASVDLDGANSYIAVPYVAELNTTAFTIEMWVQWNGSSQQMIWENKQTAAGGWHLSVNGDGSAIMRMYTSGGAEALIATTGPGVITSAWHHIAVVASDAVSEPRMYVDGVRQGYGLVYGTHAVNASGAMRLGANLTTGLADFDGKMAAAAYYNAALSASEIGDAYENAADTAAAASAYSYIIAETSAWANLGTASSVYTLNSSGLNTGSKLNVTYRDTRL